jgi:hypothetical protein
VLDGSALGASRPREERKQGQRPQDALRQSTPRAGRDGTGVPEGSEPEPPAGRGRPPAISSGPAARLRCRLAA